MSDYNPNTLSSSGEPQVRPGPLIATVVSHLDKEYSGKIEVDIGRPGGGTGSSSQLHQVSYMSPFYGTTAASNVRKDPNNYDSTQKSYGMWMIPPDVGSRVIVIFIDGNPKYGFWLGAIQDEGMNFMLPGVAATENVVDGAGFNDTAGRPGRIPVGEFNRKINTGNPNDVTKWLKPKHPLADALINQGLILDDVRGITTSSARREAPSSVFGISTPGPLDKRQDSPTGAYGKPEHEIPDYPASRLGGTTFVMDDGDDKFLRKTKAGEGPPEYASTDQKDTSGLPEIPNNELVRLRTRTGHQILLHNSEDLIYITNSRGTAWIELTSNGKIDIYAQDSISIHTEQDFNFYAGRDFNFEAGRNFNLKVANRHQTEVGGNQILIVDENQKIQIKQDVDITYEQNYKHHVIEQVDWNFDASINWNVGSGSGGGNVNSTVGGNVTSKVTGTKNETINGSVIQTIQGSLDLNITGHNNLTAGGDTNILSGGHNDFTAGGDTNILSSGNHVETAANIHMNGPQAATAATAATASSPNNAEEAVVPEPLPTYDNPTPDNSAIPAVPGDPINSIMLRIPTTEPYILHENLDPANLTPTNTDRETGSVDSVPSAWQTYSTITDTFNRIKGAD